VDDDNSRADAKDSEDSKFAESKRSSRDAKPSRGGDFAESKIEGDSEPKIRVVALMHLLDGNAADGAAVKNEMERRLNVENDELVHRALPEYSFSNDPEIRALEKKLRGVGHSLARRGVDVEGLFRNFDRSGSGMIRRTEFLEILSSMGLYILEKGKALEAASAVKHYGINDGHENHRSEQERQVARVRGVGASSEQSIRTARKYVMAAGDINRGGSATEFQVRSVFHISELSNLPII
jgi:hypothetical protein